MTIDSDPPAGSVIRGDNYDAYEGTSLDGESRMTITRYYSITVDGTTTYSFEDDTHCRTMIEVFPDEHQHYGTDWTRTNKAWRPNPHGQPPIDIDLWMTSGKIRPRNDPK